MKIQVMQIFWLCAIFAYGIATTDNTESDFYTSIQHHFTNDFAVEIDGDNTVADLVAGTHGFRLVRHVCHIFLLECSYSDCRVKIFSLCDMHSYYYTFQALMITIC